MIKSMSASVNCVSRLHAIVAPCGGSPGRVTDQGLPAPFGVRQARPGWAGMDSERAKQRLQGCYITVPTMFRDPELELDVAATRRNVRFLIERGIDARYGTLLAGGAAGDFSTMTFEERVEVAEAVVAEADGRVPVAMGAQTTSTLRAETPGQGGRGGRRRVHPGLVPVLLRAHRGRLLRVRRRGGRRGRHRHHHLQHLLDQRRRVLPHGRAADRDPERGRAEMGLPAHRRDGIRGRRQSTFAGRLTIIDNHLHVRPEPHAGRARIRGALVQLLAGVGHPADRRPRGRALS